MINYTFPSYTYTQGFQFFDKEGKTILSYGGGGPYERHTKFFEVEKNEKVIGIKAITEGDPARKDHGALYGLQFKIAKLV